MRSAPLSLHDRTAVVIGPDGPVGRELRVALDAAGARVVEANTDVRIEELGPVDVLVIHASGGPIEHCCESIAGAMSRRGGGSIVLVDPGDDGDGSTAERCRAMANRWEKHGVRVNSLAQRKLDRGPDPHFAENVGTEPTPGPQQRREEYRAALVFLASEASSRITGFQLVADGSWLAAVVR